MQRNILSTPEWHQTLATVIDHLGQAEFPHYLAQACQKVSPYNSTVIIAFPAGQRPIPAYNNLAKRFAETSMAPYLAGAYLLDPFYALYKNGAPTGIYRLKDVAPDRFYKSEYYRSYYASTQLQDEAGLLIAASDKLHLLISLGARDAKQIPSNAQFATLRTVFPELVSLCKQHWRNEYAYPGDVNKLGGPLDRAFKNFGKDFLSNRECEVIQLILKGHSSKSIARLLDISEDTVKVHRKRFHNKLEISSQAELFSLFLESIALLPMGSEEDPLRYYVEQSKTVNC